MSIPRVWWLGAAGVVVLLLVVVLAVPAWAASPGQADGSTPDAHAAMHAACEAEDVQGMAEAMNTFTGEDWPAMGDHMGGGHHGAMGSGVTGMGGMMGGRSTQSVVTW